MDVTPTNPTPILVAIAVLAVLAGILFIVLRRRR